MIQPLYLTKLLYGPLGFLSLLRGKSDRHLARRNGFLRFARLVLFAGVPARLKPCTKGTVEFFAISLGLGTCLENAYVLEREHLGITCGSNGRR